MSESKMTPAEVLAVMDRIASFHHPIDRIEVMKARAAVAELVAAHDGLLTVRETLKRECEALKAENSRLLAANRDCVDWFEAVKAERDALRQLLRRADAELDYWDDGKRGRRDWSLGSEIDAALTGAGHE